MADTTLENIQAAPVAPAAPAAAAPVAPAAPKSLGPAPIPPSLKYIAKGSYGCAVKPALPNVVNGEWKQFPSNISKLFYDSDNYRKLLRKQENVYNVFGETNDYRSTPYIHKYKTSNIPRSVRSNCNVSSSSEPLYAVRMPNLGISINSIVRHKLTYKPMLRAIPIKTLLSEIMKLFNHVRSLRNKNMIHGDIRESNIMIDPSTGKMTIIDFDWLLPEDEFMEDYGGFGFYSNPPEALLLPLYGVSTNRNDMIEKLEDDGQIYDYIKNSNAYGYRKDIGVVVNTDTIADANIKNLEFAIEVDGNNNGDDYTDILRDEIVHTFDSYGLGITLAALLYVIYPEEFTAETNKTIHSLIIDIVKPMISLEMKSRMKISDAIEKLNELIAAENAKAGGGKRTRTRKHGRKHGRKARKQTRKH